MTIVCSTYRYKRPPRTKKPVTREVPIIVRAADPKKGRRTAAPQATAKGALPTPRPGGGAGNIQPSTASERRRDSAVTAAAKAPTTDDDGPRRSAIVTTISRKESRMRRLERAMVPDPDADDTDEALTARYR